MWTALSERTYALYLLHGVVAFPVMFALYQVLPLWLDAIVGVVAMFAVVEFAYRFVDQPLNNLGRRYSRSGAAAGAGVPDAMRAAASPSPDVDEDCADDDDWDEDEYDDEPLPPDSPWWDEPNVFVTPHVAGLAPRYAEQVQQMVAENLRRFAAGRPLLNLVDRERGY